MRKLWKARVYNYDRAEWQTVGWATSADRARTYIEAAMREDVPEDEQHRSLGGWGSGRNWLYLDFSYGSRPFDRSYFYATADLQSMRANEPRPIDRVLNLEVQHAPS